MGGKSARRKVVGAEHIVDPNVYSSKTVDDLSRFWALPPHEPRTQPIGVVSHEEAPLSNQGLGSHLVQSHHFRDGYFVARSIDH
jgi:hypothetical protein